MVQIKISSAWPWIRVLLIVLGWGTANAASALSGFFEGVLVPPPLYGGHNGGGGALPYTGSSGSNMPLPTVISLQVAQEALQTTILGIPIGKLIFLLEILAIAVLSSFLLEDFGLAVLSYFLSYGLGATLFCFVLILPGLTGALPADVLVGGSVFFAFIVFFPIALFVGMFGTLMGSLLADRFS